MSLYYGDPEFFIQYSSTSFRKEQSVVSLLLMAIMAGVQFTTSLKT